MKQKRKKISMKIKKIRIMNKFILIYDNNIIKINKYKFNLYINQGFKLNIKWK